MIEVLHLATSFGRGGTELNLARLAANMDASRFSNTIVAMRRRYDGPMVQRVTQAGVRFRCLEMHAGVPDPAGFVRLLRIVREVRPQVLQTWMYHADLLGLLVGRLARVPVILWNVRSTLLNNHGIGRLVFRALVPLSSLPTAIVVNSQAGIRIHQELGYRPKKWVWIPNSLDLAEFTSDHDARRRLRQELRLPEDSFLIGLVARLDPIKDHTTFIRAAKFIAIAHPKVRFVLVGEGADANNQDLLSLIRSEGLETLFHLMGLRADVGSITSAFDIACSSSHAEGLSNAILEAMACRVPCVATNVGDSVLLIGNTGKVAPPKDPQAFANACCELIMLSPQRRIELGMNARRRVEENFSTSVIVARYQELYEGFASRSTCDDSGPAYTANHLPD